MASNAPSTENPATSTTTNTATTNTTTPNTTNPLLLPTDSILSALLLSLQNEEYCPTTSPALTGHVLQENGLTFQDPNVPKLIALAGDLFLVDIINRAVFNRDVRLTGVRNDLRKEKVDAINAKRKRENERLSRRNKDGKNNNNDSKKKGKNKEKDKEEEKVENENENEKKKEIDEFAITNEEIALYKYHKNTLNVKDLVEPLKVWGVDVSHM